MRIYEGTTDKTNSNLRKVTIDGAKLISEHSLTHECSYGWGYQGHGSRYLAEALMVTAGYSKEFATRHMTIVSERFISALPENWRFSESDLKDKINQVVAVKLS